MVGGGGAPQKNISRSPSELKIMVPRMGSNVAQSTVFTLFHAPMTSSDSGSPGASTQWYAMQPLTVR